MAYYRQPKFYRDFHCMGGECPCCCCTSWNIYWDETEFDKLMTADSSPTFKQQVINNFVNVLSSKGKPTAQYMIKFNENGCPFLDCDNYCSIQKKYGEEYLSKVCRIYPRLIFINHPIAYRTVHSSCFYAMKLLCENPKSMQLVNAPIDNPDKILSEQLEDDVFIKKHPISKYHKEIFEFFYDIISNTKRSAETSLVLGALAAQKLTEYELRGEIDHIPQVIKALRPQLNATTIPSFEKAKPNSNIFPVIPGKIIDTEKDFHFLDCLKTNGEFDPIKMQPSAIYVNKHFEKNPHILRNIALNFLFEGRFPLTSFDNTIFENYSYLVAAIACEKLMAIGAVCRDQGITDGIYIAMSFIVRSLYHKLHFKPKQVIDILKENGCSSPSYLAMMLK